MAPSTLVVAGALSFATAAAALQAMRSGVAGHQVDKLDLAGVAHSDSAGLSCVLAMAAEAQRSGRKLQVLNMPAGMCSLAQVCEVDVLMR